MMSFVCQQSAADTTTTQTQAVPVMTNFQSSGSRAQLIEVLKVYCSYDGQAEVDSQMRLNLSTKNFGTTNVSFSEPSVFAGFSRNTNITTSGTFQPTLEVFDCTDGSGNGILVATDNIYAQLNSTTTGVVNAARIKILYRVYAASVQEYVGIVQGQQ